MTRSTGNPKRSWILVNLACVKVRGARNHRGSGDLVALFAWLDHVLIQTPLNPKIALLALLSDLVVGVATWLGSGV